MGYTEDIKDAMKEYDGINYSQPPIGWQRPVNGAEVMDEKEKVTKEQAKNEIEKAALYLGSIIGTNTDRTLNDYANECYENSVRHGFWDAANGIPEEYKYLMVATKLALIHSEVSEALEAVRRKEQVFWREDGKVDGKPEGVGSELIDVVIRCLDLCSYLGVDCDEIYRAKTEYNKSRPQMHGGKLF